MSFLDRIAFCNTYDLSNFVPFFIGQKVFGWVEHGVAKHLADATSVFSVAADRVSFNSGHVTSQEKSHAIAELADNWVAQNFVRPLTQELYPVRASWSAPDQFQLDRALVPFFGVRAYGVHLNGYVKQGDRCLLWIGKRAADRIVEPEKLDNMVAGGQPAGLSVMENLIKECEEEAAMPATLARLAKPVGTVSYCLESEWGLKPDTLFCYDLEVSEDFTPTNKDGEIEGFHLMPIEEALSLIAEGEAFKFNVPLVILDFAIRHGILTPDNEPDYEAILAGLHAPPPEHSIDLRI